MRTLEFHTHMVRGGINPGGRAAVKGLGAVDPAVEAMTAHVRGPGDPRPETHAADRAVEAMTAFLRRRAR